MREAPTGEWTDGSQTTGRHGVLDAVLAIRAVFTPSNLSVVAVLALSWVALLSWTGVGTGSWQARACVDYDLGSSACSPGHTLKDQSRLIPHSTASRIAQ